MTSDNRSNMPGWNDPPILNYTSQNPPPKSRINSRRIPFPLLTETGGQMETTDEISHVKPIQQATCCNQNPSVLVENNSPPLPWDSSKNLLIAKQHFRTLLNRNSNDEIEKRLKLMEDMWENEQFTEYVQKLIVELSISLIEGNHERLQQLQVQLMTEHATACSCWMSAIRYLARLPTTTVTDAQS